MSGSSSSARDSVPAVPHDSAEPIGLTIHSLPSPGLAPAKARSGRLKMLLVLAVCAAPVVASYFTYYVIRPQSRSSHGALIEPQRPLPSASALPLTDLEGRAVDPASLAGQWLLVAVGGGACDALCEKQLYLQRQLREALGRDKDRVDRVWLIDDAQPVRAELRPALAGATVLRADAAALRAWLAPASSEPMAPHFFVVDPRGHLMMRFPAPSEPKPILRDLSRLLRASASWDQAGR